MNFLKKLQNLPQDQKKIILWVIMAVISVFVFAMYVQKVKKALKYNKTENVKEELQIEKLKEDLQNIPEF